MIKSRLKALLFDSPQKREAQELYIALVHESRKPFFYEACAVPDTLDGRFDMIVLHVFLALHALTPGIDNPRGGTTAPPRHAEAGSHPPFGKGNEDTARYLQETLYDDMDRSLREMGVGDMGIAKRIKAMSQAALGRIEAYRAAFDNDDEMRAALARNIYRGTEIAPVALEKLLHYTREFKPSLS